MILTWVARNWSRHWGHACSVLADYAAGICRSISTVAMTRRSVSGGDYYGGNDADQDEAMSAICCAEYPQVVGQGMVWSSAPARKGVGRVDGVVFRHAGTRRCRGFGGREVLSGVSGMAFMVVLCGLRRGLISSGIRELQDGLPAIWRQAKNYDIDVEAYRRNLGYGLESESLIASQDVVPACDERVLPSGYRNGSGWRRAFHQREDDPLG